MEMINPHRVVFKKHPENQSENMMKQAGPVYQNFLAATQNDMK